MQSLIKRLLHSGDSTFDYINIRLILFLMLLMHYSQYILNLAISHLRNHDIDNIVIHGTKKEQHYSLASDADIDVN